VEIIPVIDVMGGKVVHARGGERAEYPLLESTLTTSHDPVKVIMDLLAYYSFSTFYIADLDAIMSGKRNDDLYFDLSQANPKTNFYIDAGITDKNSWQTLAVNANVYPVIGSETLVDRLWLNDVEVQNKSILSLDFKRGDFLGDENLLKSPSLWPKQIIAMNLDCIGSQLGPDLKLLADLKNKSSSDVIAAGGVRTEQDLIALQQQGIERVLVASALHDGRINKRVFETICSSRK